MNQDAHRHQDKARMIGNRDLRLEEGMAVARQGEEVPLQIIGERRVLGVGRAPEKGRKKEKKEKFIYYSIKYKYK